LNAAKKIILLLWLVLVASHGNASALTPGTLENRIWEKSWATLETRQAGPLQTTGLHQENGSAGYDFAPDSLLAAKEGAGKSLLPGEVAVGTYDDLISAGTKGDNITPHHIPSANHMKQYGVSKGEGVAINMEHPHPGVGGRHRETASYGTEVDLNMSPRDALGFGVRDARSIYLRDGLYSPEIRQQLQEVIRRNQVDNPGLFNRRE